MKCLGILTILLFFSVFVNAQDCDHISDGFQRFDNIRIAPPAKVTFIDGKTLDYVSQNHRETRAGTFEISKDTAVDKGIKKGDLVWIIYCIADNHVYAVHQLTPEQRKTMKQ
jgi:hypothetical protein